MTEQERETVKRVLDERRDLMQRFYDSCQRKINELEEHIANDSDCEDVMEKFPFIFSQKEIDGRMREMLAMKLDMEMESGLCVDPVLKSSNATEPNAESMLEANGYDPGEIILLKDESYDSALIGVTTDGRAVYSYRKMVDWYMEKNDCNEEDAMEWIDYNTIRSLPYAGEMAPIIVNEFEEEP